MKFCSLMVLVLLLQAGSNVSPTSTAQGSPDAVVRELYQMVVAGRPLGIPKGRVRAAIWPFLSKRLTQRLEAAQACEDDYFRQHATDTGKIQFAWLERGIFSGEDERAMPAEAVVERTDPQQDGSFHVFVTLSYGDIGEAYGRLSDPANTLRWRVAAVVITEDQRFVVDDVLLFKDDSMKSASRLSDSFPGCDGSRWVGDKPKAR